MRSNRDPSAGEPSRSERADAAARRLALLAADLGAADGGPRTGSWSPDDDYTRVVLSRRALPPAPVEPPVSPPLLGPVSPPGSPPDPPPASPGVVPRPGRHAARRRLVGVPRWSSTGPGLGAAQLTVLAVIVAVGVAFAAWWVVRDQAGPPQPMASPAPSTANPLVAGAPTAEPPGPTARGPGDTTGTTGTAGTVTVDVTGKVRRPGIVVLDNGSRVVDAVEAAGGERPGVDLGSLNLARVLVDGEQIVVGSAQPPSPVPPSGSTAPGAPPALVNLNTASQAELETLPDVGPVTALAIVAWRDEHGGFTSVDELLEVDGIGPVTLEGLTPYVTL